MNHIYIVKNEVGEYEDRTERSLCAVSTEEKAKTFVQQFIELNQFNCAFSNRIRDEFNSNWQINHPRPEAPVKPKVPESFHILQNILTLKKQSLSLKEYQSLDYKSLVKEIEETKISFKDIQDQHHNNLKAYEATLSDYQKAYAFHVKDIELAQKEWIDKNYIIPSHLKDVADIADYANHTSDLGNKYSYYELSVIH